MCHTCGLLRLGSLGLGPSSPSHQECGKDRPGDTGVDSSGLSLRYSQESLWELWKS